MAITLFGNQTGLILVSESFNKNDGGIATLQRTYSCARSSEATGDSIMAINTAPLSYTLPTGVYNLICASAQKEVQNGVVTYSVNYVGLTSDVFKTRYGNSILNYSKSVTTGTGASAVTVLHTGTYVAPTASVYYVSASASYVPPTPVSPYSTQIIESFADGVEASPPTLTPSTKMTNLESTKVGDYYIIQITGTQILS
jgi:hypothetical protein